MTWPQCNMMYGNRVVLNTVIRGVPILVLLLVMVLLSIGISNRLRSF